MLYPLKPSVRYPNIVGDLIALWWGTAVFWSLDGWAGIKVVFNCCEVVKSESLGTMDKETLVDSRQFTCCIMSYCLACDNVGTYHMPRIGIPDSEYTPSISRYL